MKKKNGRDAAVGIRLPKSAGLTQAQQAALAETDQASARNKADVHDLLTTKLFCGKCGTMVAGGERQKPYGHSPLLL